MPHIQAKEVVILMCQLHNVYKFIDVESLLSLKSKPFYNFPFFFKKIKYPIKKTFYINNGNN